MQITCQWCSNDVLLFFWISSSGICTITVPDVVHTPLAMDLSKTLFLSSLIQDTGGCYLPGICDPKAQIVFALHLNVAVAGRLAATAPPFMLWSLPFPTEIKEACQHIQDWSSHWLILLLLHSRQQCRERSERTKDYGLFPLSFFSFLLKRSYGPIRLPLCCCASLPIERDAPPVSFSPSRRPLKFRFSNKGIRLHKGRILQHMMFWYGWKYIQGLFS